MTTLANREQGTGNRRNQRGYSLVEVLVSITVLLISVVGPLTIAAKGLQNASYAKQQNTAFFLAQEGLEGIVKHREEGGLEGHIATGAGGGPDAWDNVLALGNVGCTENSPCGIDIESDFSLFDCDDPGETCDLFLHDSGRTRYNHYSSGGTATAYDRKLMLDVDTTRAYVRVVVTWGEDEDQSLELATYIYNIYEK